MKSTLYSYIAGFVLSIILTLAAYFAVANHFLNGSGLLIFILVLAIIQLVIQLIFFLHITQEKSPRWNLIFFLSTVSLVLIIVVGSLWIMAHLNYNMMTPQQMEKYTQSQDGI